MACIVMAYIVMATYSYGAVEHTWGYFDQRQRHGPGTKTKAAITISAIAMQAIAVQIMTM